MDTLTAENRAKIQQMLANGISDQFAPEGVCVNEFEDAAEEEMARSLSATTLEAYMNEFEPATHIIRAYNAMLDKIPKAIPTIGPYCITNIQCTHTRRDHVPTIVAFRFEYCGIYGIDIPHDIADPDIQRALCVRNGFGCTDACFQENQHVLELLTPNEARMLGRSYVNKVVIRIIREVYTTAPNATASQIADLESAIDRNMVLQDDTRGRWLYTCIKEGAGAFGTLVMRQEYSNTQCYSTVNLPKIVGSKGCVMAPESRKTYTLQDYGFLREDPRDPAGYLIINGSEKMIQMLIRGSTNQVITTTDGNHWKSVLRVRCNGMDPIDTDTCYVTTNTADSKVATTKLSRTSSIKEKTVTNEERVGGNTVLWFGATWFKCLFPVSVFQMALGAVTDRSTTMLLGSHLQDDPTETQQIVYNTITHARKLCDPIADLICQQLMSKGACRSTAWAIASQRAAQIVIVDCAKQSRYARETLATHSDKLEYFENTILPRFMAHTHDVPSKSLTLMQMSSRILDCISERALPDRIDHLGYKQIYSVEFIMHTFLTSMRQSAVENIKYVQKRFEKHRFALENKILLDQSKRKWKFDMASNRLEYTFATGNMKHNNNTLVGMSASTDRLSRISMRAQLGSVASDLPDTSSSTDARQLDTTHWGLFCSIHTPEGKKIGLKTHMAVTAAPSPELPKDQLEALFACIEDTKVAISTNNIVERFMQSSDNRMLNAKPVLERAGENATQLDILAELCDPTTTRVMLDGACVALTHTPYGLCTVIKAWREEHIDRIYVSSAYIAESNTVVIRTNAGRPCRPLFRLNCVYGQEGHSYNQYFVKLGRNARLMLMGSLADRRRITWKRLFDEGAITMTDALEEESMYIATGPKYIARENPSLVKRVYTHMEIDPISIFGITGAICPFPEHSQSPRCIYQCQMAGQAMGVALYNANYGIRVSTQYEMYYTQRPLTMGRLDYHANHSDAPAGTVLLTAFSTYTGYGQEDGTICNTRCKDFGAMRTVVTNQYNYVEERQRATKKQRQRKSNAGDTMIGNPVLYQNCEMSSRRREYYTLHREECEDGLPTVGMRLRKGDPVIGIVQRAEDTEEGQVAYVDKSIVYKKDDPARVTSVRVYNVGKKRAVTVTTIKVRQFTVGDKGTVRPSQKGTQGLELAPENMPIIVGDPSKLGGLSVELIMNPHALPSRMTIGLLIECLGSLVAIGTGRGQNSTPFRNHFTDSSKADTIYEQVRQLGFNRHGLFPLRNPITGEIMRESSSVDEHGREVQSGRVVMHFVGFIWYQRLKHMAIDKIHSSRNAPREKLSRQPVQGKSNNGAIRFGEMERDCMISHGAAQFLRDRTFWNSDQYMTHVCDMCGLIAIANLTKQTFECRSCRNTTLVSVISIPYATKLMFQELMSMGIAPRILTTRHKHQKTVVPKKIAKTLEYLPQ